MIEEQSSFEVHELRGERNFRAEVLNFGATLLSLEVPDGKGRAEDVTLGFASPEDYAFNAAAYFGATVGRFANRIRQAKFVRQGRECLLSRNWKEHQLHGGRENFSLKFWDVEVRTPNSIKLRLFSPHGDQGFPGNLTATVFYALESGNRLRIVHEAFSDRTTPVNMTHHAYFNLKGQTSAGIHGHSFALRSRFYLPTDGDLLPTGEIRSVKNTAFDFSRSVPLGERIPAEFDNRRESGGGFDHGFVLDGERSVLREAAEVEEPESGRKMTVFTTAPCLHFYSGNGLSCSPRSKIGEGYSPFSGFCLETQGFTDSPNLGHFIPSLASPSLPFRQTTVFAFSTR